MSNKERMFLLIVGVFMVVVIVFYGMSKLSSDDTATTEIQNNESAPVEEVQEEEKVEKEFVNVFFIGQNENHEEVYKAVKREYKKEIDGSKLTFAIKSLVKGPTATEKAKGVYSELPVGTTILAIDEFPDKAIVNLSNSFQTGGGTDSLYKRLYQLIKTSKINSKVPVYLYINGQKADVIGGDGIMLTQPLNDRSLDD